MTNDEFRSRAHQLVDWMADYLDGVEQYPVRSQVAPGDILDQLPAAPPANGETFDRILADFDSIIMPGMTHWQHPGFFAYFPANSSPPSVLAEMLTATLGAQCMSWQTSPAATELEQRVMEWLGQMIGLPGEFTGVIQDSASSATLCALLSARERATGGKANAEGLGGGDDLIVYCSTECHSSIEKDVRVAGLGSAHLRKIETDAEFAMRPDALAAAIEADLAAGAKPICVVAALGTTGSGAVDPLAAIGEICARHGIWLHVDAAWAGSALLLAENRWMIDGIGHVDSFVFNPHKWLFTNFDCSAYFVRDPDLLIGALTILPEFLRTREDSAVNNYRDWGVPLGRRFRALKLWFVIRAYGVEALSAMIREHIRLAALLADWVEADPDFELLVPRSLGLLCLRYRPPGADAAQANALSAVLIERINDTGDAYLSHTQLNGAFAIRVSIGQTRTAERHVAALWQLMRDTAKSLNARPAA